MEYHKVVTRRSVSEDKKRIYFSEPIHNSNTHNHSNNNTRETKKKFEIKDIKQFTQFFLQGELMRQFLLDEDIWLFIQNVKMKLKENPVEFDNWLDSQLQLAKVSPGNFFNAGAPPFHHVKKGMESNFICNSGSVSSLCSGTLLNQYSSAEQLGYQQEIMKEEKKDDITANYNHISYPNNSNVWSPLSKEKTLKSIEIEKKKTETSKKQDSGIITDKTETPEKGKQHKNYNGIDLEYKKNVNNVEENNVELNDMEQVQKKGANNINNNDNDEKKNYILKEENRLPIVNTSVEATIPNEKDYDIMKRRKRENSKGVGQYYTDRNEINEIYEREIEKGEYSLFENSNTDDIKNVTKGRRKKNCANIMIRRYFDTTDDDSNAYVDANEVIEKEIKEKQSGLHMEQFSEIEKFIAEKMKEREEGKKEQNSKTEGMDNTDCINKTEVGEQKKKFISIPRITPKIDEQTNNDMKQKLKELFAPYNNRMNIEVFENVIVIDFLKIGRYMSHTLFSKIVEENADFVTYENVAYFFHNRFIDGTKDPSYYNDKRYKNMFKCPKEDFDETNVLVPNFKNSENVSEEVEDVEEKTEINSSTNQKIDHITVPFKKCSIFNFFNAIKDDIYRDFLEIKDFDPYIREIINRNKSLQFLLKHAEFLERYIESVIIRIYYQVDICDTNKIYLRDLLKNDLAHIWCYLDDSVHVQNVRKYFSYSHFYVYYSTFCQISSCKDMLIDDSDLYRFDNHSLNGFIVNRIWSKISMKLTGPNQKYMCLNDWIYFIMNYEDMTSNRAIEFWFKLIDLDGDSIIKYHEIQVFFNIQIDRLKSHCLEEPKFEDWLCQMNDAIQPAQEGNFTLSDFKRNKKFAAHFFGCLVSLSKLLTWESRDVHKELQIETEFPEWSPWDVYCKTKYDEMCFMEYQSSFEEIQDNFDSCDNYDIYEGGDVCDSFDTDDSTNVYVLETN